MLAGLIATPAVAERPAEFLGNFRLEQRVAYFGGLSGLEFSADGQSFVTLSDSAVLFSGTVERDEKGAVTSVTLDGPGRALRGPDGRDLYDPNDDSEGLALTADGALYISFELENRVARFNTDGSWVEDLPRPREFYGLARNWGLEALAAAPDGSLYTLPEGDPSGVRSFPVYRYAAGQWTRIFVLPEDHTWRPVGADFDAQGRLYVLERDFWGLIGFRTRLRQITFDGADVITDRVLVETRAGRFQNLEGVSVWQDAAGRNHATMVSDDNFVFTQHTQFVDYLIND